MTTDSLAARVLQGQGLIEGTVDAVLARVTGRARPFSRFTVEAEVTDPERALLHLSRLTWPATRHVLMPVEAGWLACINNGKNGSDFNELLDFFGQSGACRRAVRVVDCPGRVWRRDKLREILAYEARILDLAAPDVAECGSISCVNDGGRWSFDRIGAVAAELPCAPDARRGRDRFSREHLTLALAQLGVPRMDADRFRNAGRYWLLREEVGSVEWAARIERDACTLEESNDPAHRYFAVGVGDAEHVATHATSVVSCLERAILINPAYAERARPYLEAAHRALKGG